MKYKLVDEKTGAEIHIGDIVVVPDGDKYAHHDEKFVLLEFDKYPAPAPSTGLVVLKSIASPDYYYPSVIGAKIVDAE